MNALNKIEKAQRAVFALCIPRGYEGHADWIMSIPANPDIDPDLVIGGALGAPKEEIERLTAWVNDLQSGMYINCVYCGYRYGPQDEIPCTMGEALKAHIEVCPKHPVSALRREHEALKDCLKRIRTRADLMSADIARSGA